MHRLKNASYRSLERLCRIQAAIASSKEAKAVLEEMAEEYRRLADTVSANGSRAPGGAGPPLVGGPRCPAGPRSRLAPPSSSPFGASASGGSTMLGPYS